MSMQLHELKSVLKAHPRQEIRFVLPTGAEIPAAFHVTEVGQVSKVFVDCGGKVHSELKCVLQTWIGSDGVHRLLTDRLGKILDIARSVVATDALEVEVEYEDAAISQYPIAGWSSQGGALVFDLESRHTDCLAKAHCDPSLGEDACCADGISC
jgi:hypothetical protein